MSDIHDTTIEVFRHEAVDAPGSNGGTIQYRRSLVVKRCGDEDDFNITVRADDDGAGINLDRDRAVDMAEAILQAASAVDSDVVVPRRIA